MPLPEPFDVDYDPPEIWVDLHDGDYLLAKQAYNRWRRARFRYSQDIGEIADDPAMAIIHDDAMLDARRSRFYRPIKTVNLSEECEGMFNGPNDDIHLTPRPEE